MRRRAVVVPEALFRLLEMAADDIREFCRIHNVVRIKRVKIVERNQPRRHVPLMIAAVLVCSLDVGRRYVVGSEDEVVQLWIFVADRRIGIKSQRLVIADCERNLSET